MREIKLRAWDNIKKRYENEHDDLWLHISGDYGPDSDRGLRGGAFATYYSTRVYLFT